MQVGDYVRTNKGIARIIGKNDDVIYTYPDAWETDTYLKIVDDTEYLYEEDIIKSSPDILDLIEVGDYVNGYYVEDIRHRYDGEMITILKVATGSNYFQAPMYEEDIKSIVTKEQFESIKYEVE